MPQTTKPPRLHPDREIERLRDEARKDAFKALHNLPDIIKTRQKYITLMCLASRMSDDPDQHLVCLLNHDARRAHAELEIVLEEGQ